MRVIELTCMTCRANSTISEDDQRNREQGFYPTCVLCGSPLTVIKPEDKLEEDAWNRGDFEGEVEDEQIRIP